MEASRESPSAGRLQSEGSRKAGKKPPPRSRRRPRSQSACEPYASRPSVDTIPGYHRTHHSQLSVAGSVPARPWRAFAECSRPSNTPPYLPASRLHYCSLLETYLLAQLFSHSDVFLFHPVSIIARCSRHQTQLFSHSDVSLFHPVHSRLRHNPSAPLTFTPSILHVVHGSAFAQVSRKSALPRELPAVPSSYSNLHL
jgi:hypothetical protein